MTVRVLSPVTGVLAPEMTDTSKPVPDGSAKAVDAARGKLIDDVAGTNDELTEKYLTDGDLTQEELDQGLRAAVKRCDLVDPSIFEEINGEAGVFRNFTQGDGHLNRSARNILCIKEGGLLLSARRTEGRTDLLVAITLAVGYRHEVACTVISVSRAGTAHQLIVTVVAEGGIQQQRAASSDHVAHGVVSVGFSSH